MEMKQRFAKQNQFVRLLFLFVRKLATKTSEPTMEKLNTKNSRTAPKVKGLIASVHARLGYQK